MPNDLGTQVKRTAYFSWGWKGSSRLMCVVSKGSEA